MTVPETDPPHTAGESTTLREIRHSYSKSFFALLDHLGCSLLVSTYQAGKLIVLGTRGGEPLLSFHNFERAMGLAVSPDRLALGGKNQVWFLHSASDLARRLDPPGCFDVCFLTRTAHLTGDIHCHEMAWSGRELWVVNTLFGCLCTLHEDYSFVPRWRPPFISALAAEDRCHLNGLAMDGGRPRFVTALSETDTPQGWRPDKAKSGVLMEVPSGNVIARGLAMPHSPRLFGGRLWVLNSGHGHLALVDPASGSISPAAILPGYTRGMGIFKGFAFVGLSKIRETSTFGGLPIAERRQELKCGVGVVELATGHLAAHFEFEVGVDEIFNVQVLPGFRCPALSGPFPDLDNTQTIWLVPTNPPPEERPEGPTASALNERGIARAKAGHYEEAAADFRECLRLSPRHAPAWSNLGNAARALNQVEEARRAFQRAVELDPSAWESHVGLGTLLRDFNQPEQALAHFQQARALQPEHPQVLAGLAATLRALRRPEEAQVIAERLVQSRPADAEAHVALGNNLQEMNRLEEARGHLETATRLQPDSANAHNCLGIALHRLGRLDEAKAAFDRSLKLRPDWPDAHVHKAFTLLLEGDYPAGWREYEWRWRLPGRTLPPVKAPMWDGSPVTGRTILFLAEQGLGDTLQFLRFAPLLKRQGARVLFRGPSRLLPLLRHCPGLDGLHSQDDPAPACDTFIPLLSIPARLALTRDSIPAEVPYLHADPARSSIWKQRLPKNPGLRVGICWQGDPTFPGDRYRSIPLPGFAPFAKVPGVQLISLQHGPAREELAANKALAVDLGPDLDGDGAFIDTAAVMKHLDLVITADTATAHVAGALGVKTWVALSQVPDWRWFIDRSDSPWYPSLQLFRQSRWDDWDEPFAKMAAELHALVR